MAKNLFSGRIAALAGGVGAARLLAGLQQVMPPENLTAIVNTGDDFDWMGLHISPDLDTIVYTLGGVANPETGWGIYQDSFRCLERLGALGGDTWFRIGDLDLATHLLRTHRLNSGIPLSVVTQEIAGAHGVRTGILPMSDSRIPTLVHTREGTLAFQDYFVRRRCAPPVRGFSYQYAENSRPAPGVMKALAGADGIIICPSNPYISIGPILAVPGIRSALAQSGKPVIAVTPIISECALKGPAAEMLRELRHDSSALAVAQLYLGLADVFVLDRRDAHLEEGVEKLAMRPHLADTLMDSEFKRIQLAQELLDLVG